MAFSATVTKVMEGPRNVVFHITGKGDGTGDETLIKKVDVSTLTPAKPALKLMKIYGTVDFGIVELFWDATTPLRFEELSGRIESDYTRFGGLPNTSGGGRTGSILLSTIGFNAGSIYDLTLEMVKKSP